MGIFIMLQLRFYNIHYNDLKSQAGGVLSNVLIKKSLFVIMTQNLRLGVWLSMCLIFWQFEPGRALEICAYELQ